MTFWVFLGFSDFVSVIGITQHNGSNTFYFMAISSVNGLGELVPVMIHIHISYSFMYVCMYVCIYIYITRLSHVSVDVKVTSVSQC